MKNIFDNILVWRKSHELALVIYKLTRSFPSEERYGLVDDMRRAARSVPTNIVEGYKRKGYKDSMKFFNYSDASLCELRYQTKLAFDLGYLIEPDFNSVELLEDQVGRLLHGWQKTYLPKQ
ncbi:four helix bundle protein [Candidatus Peregrinibacteria bacterium]|nr:MAG: four helix bundle protein [Candidatus Peregrinibacteria bacterium]